MLYIRINNIKLVLSLALAFSPGLVGIFLARASLNPWYADLIKPWFIPPNAIFVPVWLILYLLLGLSLFLVWRERSRYFKTTFIFFLIQLGLNLAWSIVFFSLKSIGGGLIVTIALWLSILTMLMVFNRISKLAGLLQIPYLLWVSYGVALSFALYILNS